MTSLDVGLAFSFMSGNLYWKNVQTEAFSTHKLQHEKTFKKAILNACAACCRHRGAGAVCGLEGGKTYVQHKNR